MPPPPIGTILGSLLLLHAAYSLQQYRSLVLDLEESTTGMSSIVAILEESSSSLSTNSDTISIESGIRMIPIDVYLELGLAFGLLFLSELMRTGSSLRPVVTVVSSSSPTKDPQRKRQHHHHHRPMMAPAFVTRDFDIYATRGKGL
jgi:hypothetical protein